MTYEQYWEQDSWLVKYYRRAWEIRRDEVNFEAWLQGMYVYEAIADVSPILHPFAKRGTKARKYAEKPYEFTRRSDEKKTDSQKAAQDRADQIKAKMFAFMQAHNKEMARERIRQMQEAGDEPGRD